MMNDVPQVVRKRLVLLERLLSQMCPQDAGRLQGARRVKSQEIAKMAGWSSATVRHDLWLLGYGEGVSNGYDVNELHCAVRGALGIADGAVTKCCIVGLGRIGAAFLDEEIFESSRFRVVAGFDQNVNRTEILRSAFPLYPAARLENVVTQEKIKYALLCVENKNAQKMAERLGACGVCGIANYTSAVLPAMKGVAIENCSPALALFAMDCETV